ncbi:DUF3280 domain-containing protein [Ancylobacter sp. Lp-2]|uniref:DUF2380 domain-containing protein n=1 Tax=Ancylobacter sp. Lp-2 TaxID=2881339 RepID=UPI001E47B98F|nr:DUF2380 domain-containing protein [Ancylobacter sp. Lp-2]MCB4767407.1 DUF3280 domain-containing protein [Ancylobacter sp. Lp-2]
MRLLSLAFLATGLVLSLTGMGAAEPVPPAAVAIMDFQYLDTSGEVRDQTADHQARLKRFMSGLRQEVAASDQFRVVALACQPCALTDANAPELTEAARQAGADLLLVGGIQKMSTLVQWAKVALIDLKTDKKVLERLYTFRGDSDEAWRNAEGFIAGQIVSLYPRGDGN